VGVLVLTAAGAVTAMNAAGPPRSVGFADLRPAAQVEKGQAVATRAGAAMERLSFLSARSAEAPPLSGAGADRVARAEPAIVVSGPGAGSNVTKPSRKRVSLAALGWAVLAVAVLAAAVAAPLLLRRHRNRQDTPP
jgi:hypothetical protein